MSLSRSLTLAIALVFCSQAAGAEDDVTFTVTNTSALSVTAFFAGLPGETDINLLSGALEPNASAEVTIPAGQSACVRNLRIVFADDTARDRPDVDLCNMDGFLIE